MGQIWLHIGSPKTGTTALQGFLSENAERLRSERGVNFVRAARQHIAHNQLAAAARMGQAERLFEQIAEEVDADPGAAHIVSSELLFNPQTARRMITAIPDHLRDRTKVLCYIRRQDSYLEALYKQFLKNSRIRPDRQAFLHDAPRRIRYLEVLNGYARIFGHDAITVRPFTKDHLVAGDIVRDFADQVGLTLTDDLRLPGMTTNKTLSAAMSELLATLGENTEFNIREIVRELIEIDHPGTTRKRDVFTRAERRRFMEGMTEENRRLVSRYMPGCDRFFDISDLEGETSEDDPNTRALRDLEDRLAAQDALMRAIGNIQRRRAQEAELQAENAPGAASSDGVPDPLPIPSWYREIYPAGNRRGWFENLGDHSLSFVERGAEQLVVSFDNLSQAGDTAYAREPWAQKFCADRNFSHLGVYAQVPLWFRDADLIACLERLARDGMFARFKSVAFVGTSMGGFAALSFAALAPGSNIVAFSPQSTLDAQKVPWENRFAKGRAADWSLPYSDAADAVGTANRAYVVYDPFHDGDRAHVERLYSAPLVPLKGFGLGHKSALVLNRMEILKTVMSKGIAGTLRPAEFYRAIRARKEIYLYRHAMEGYLRGRGQPDRAEKFGAVFRRYRRLREAV